MPDEPNNCDICSNNFLSHKIYYCPDCGLCYCDSCWDREHHCYDDDEDMSCFDSDLNDTIDMESEKDFELEKLADKEAQKPLKRRKKNRAGQRDICDNGYW